MYHFLDTSAILNGALKQFKTNIYISPLVLTELENIKTSNNKDNNIKYLAREAIREIISSNDIEYSIISQKQIDKILKKYSFLSNINDHRLLCEASLIAQNTNKKIEFITSDGALFLFARQIPNIEASFLFDETPVENEDYCGWGKYYPSEDQLALLYSDSKMNILNAKINEFCEIFVDGALKDVLFWNGKEYRPLKYKEFTSNLGERVKPRNLEQKMYLDLLQNKDVPVKLCTAKFGTGKSWLATMYALHEVQIGNFDKLVFVKNNLEVKGAGKLGILPGNEIDKQLPWLRQLEDHIGAQAFEEMLNNQQIEPAHLSTLRGRDLKNSIIIVDEAENLLATNIQLLLGRIAENSEIIFCADIKQCDYINKEMSGIPKLINCLAGEKLFGMVKLLKTERSAVAALADLMD